MKINIVGRKVIKPCTPTPSNLAIYKISYIDEMSPEMDVPILLFYQFKPKEISPLEESLAKILPQFYPLAGRYIRKDHTVDCSDQGVEFIETKASDAVLTDILGASTAEDLIYLLPRINYRVFDATDPLLSIQTTEFACGGLVIGISISHKICDASSLGTLIAAWSNATNPERKISITPSFDCSSFFPPKIKDEVVEQELVVEGDEVYQKIVTSKRFVFNKQVITRLRSKLMKNGGEQPWISRVRVVTAVIAKALMGVDVRNRGKWRSSIISHVVNMRERTIPPLHKHACGNLGMMSFTRRIETGEETGVRELVREVGDAISKSISDCAVMFSGGGKDVLDSLVRDRDDAIISPDQNLVMFTDWSKFGFYDADFGWGKPVWVGAGVMPWENVVLLVDNVERDGIEAWVHLLDNEMPCLEQELEKLLIS